MNDVDGFSTLIEATEPVKEVMRAVKLEPARLLRDICLEFERSGSPVPDFKLNLTGYLRDVALRALVAAGLITQAPGGRYSLYEYQPTESGRAWLARLDAAGYPETGGRGDGSM